MCGVLSAETVELRSSIFPYLIVDYARYVVVLLRLQVWLSVQSVCRHGLMRLRRRASVTRP
eukprot:6708595-Alexandrium_andersonii.AAC.1